MSTAATFEYDHPVTAVVARFHAELDALVDAGVWSMAPAELARTLPALTRLRARVTEVELRVAHHAARVGLGAEVGAADSTAWWANTTKMTKPEAHRLARLAKALDSAHEPVRDALAAGELLLDQAKVIIDIVDALPSDLVDPELVAKAEAHLIRLAVDHDARQLRVLGGRVLDVLAPEVSEEHQRRELEREEERARAKARFTMSDDGHGRCHGRFTIPSLHGAMLNKALLAIAAPKHQAATGAAPTVSGRVAAPLRLGHAFMEYIETYPADRLPHAGGVNATVVVTTEYDTVRGLVKAACVDLVITISPGEVQRLACEAGVVPMILDARSQPLDVGRRNRFHTKAQRLAMGVRDQGCTAVGCDWPPGMCHAHHPKAWSKGGETSLANGMLLCPRHHSFAHHPKYQMQDAENGKVTFHRRT